MNHTLKQKINYLRLNKNKNLAFFCKRKKKETVEIFGSNSWL